ncbi:MAG: phage holin family protein [Patescibacteria group bacterium]
MKLLTKIAITALALLIVTKLSIGVTIDGLWSAVIAAIVLGIVNTLVRPVLVVLTLPITLLTLGLFIFIINAALFYVVASIVDGFYVAGFVSALLGSLLVSILSALGNWFVGND